MTLKHKAILLLLLVFNLPCFAGGPLKGNLIDDKIIIGFFVSLLMIHVLAAGAYFGEIAWLRILCAVLYIPIFFIVAFLCCFSLLFALLFIPTVAFYAFVIIRKRK